MWTARTILKNLADQDHRRRILEAFWKHADQASRLQAEVELAEALRYRHVKIHKMPAAKKVQLLATRLGSRNFEHHFETALVQYLTHDSVELLSAFLDQWGIAHKDGMIEEENVEAPTAAKVSEALEALKDRFPAPDIALYFASAGLLMGEEWQDVMWPEIDGLLGQSS